jgi:hypothetical protein
MSSTVAIEDIEGMRRRAGVADPELRAAIRGLRVGDLVRLTLLTGVPQSAGETLRVRITRIRGGEYRGKLADAPASARLAGLRCGSAVVFTRRHIHSLANGQATS